MSKSKKIKVQCGVCDRQCDDDSTKVHSSFLPQLLLPSLGSSSSSSKLICDKCHDPLLNVMKALMTFIHSMTDLEGTIEAFLGLKSKDNFNGLWKCDCLLQGILSQPKSQLQTILDMCSGGGIERKALESYGHKDSGQELDFGSTVADSSSGRKNTSRQITDSQCNVCPKKFRTKSGLKSHKRVHVKEGIDDNGKYHCTHCPAIFEDHQLAKEHRTNAHDNPRDFCVICDKQFSKGTLQQHLFSHYKKKGSSPRRKKGDEGVPIINCGVCSKPFWSPLLLASHMDVHKGTRSCEVASCKKSFYSLAAKNLHVTSVHHPSNPTRTDCSYCFDTFQDEGSRDTHETRHEKDIFKRKFLCEGCGCSYITKQSLQRHAKLCVIKSEERKVKSCSVCGKAFATSQRLRVHLLSHESSNRKYVCSHDGCSSSFNQKVSLENHVMAQHSGDMRYRCDLCDHPGFTYIQGLRGHKYKVHGHIEGGEEGKVCKVCFKTFELQEDLAMHEALHKKLQCRICNRQLKSSSHLKEHLLRHATIRPFVCPYCSRSFVRQKQLDHHLDKIHHVKNNKSNASSDERITYIIQIAQQPKL